jgi:hypothetical protein
MRGCKFFVMSAIAITGMAVSSTGASAQTPDPHCRPGTKVACTILGKPGTKECLGEGEGFGPCNVNPTPPVTGVVLPNYLILTVVYAPPGTTAPQTTTGQQSTSVVSYESDSTTGSTKSHSHSFKGDYQVSAKADCDLCTIFQSGGVSFEYSHNTTNSQQNNVTKKTTSVIAGIGPVEDAVDHNFDAIWLVLTPKYDIAVSDATGPTITWTLDSNQSAGVPIYIYAGWLKNPSQMPPGVLQSLQAAGVTPADYQTILLADPLAQCLQPVNQLQSRLQQAGSTLPAPCVTPAPTPSRYVSNNTNLPYEPPEAAGNAVPPQQYILDSTSNTQTTDTYEQDYTQSVTITGGLSVLNDVFNISATGQKTWVEQDISQNQNLIGTEQKASLSMGGPAFGYAGPIGIDVYYDMVYKTFAFVPSVLPSGALHGAISSSEGKPVVGQLVTASAGGVTYRTYTNAKGEYHFSRLFNGPIDLAAGATTLRLPELEAGKSVDLSLK